MHCDMKKIFSAALDHFGEAALAMESRDSIMKNTLFESCRADGVTFLKLRDAIMTVGKILEEDPENNIYIASVPVGGSNALAVAVPEKNEIEFAVWYKEGLIRRNGARKAVDRILKEL